MIYVLVAKTAIDAGCTVAFLTKSPAMALMFFGFAVADAGALWLAGNS